MRDVGFGAWICAALLLGVWLAITGPREAEAHVTKCPETPVELVQWWQVETKTDTGGCSVSVNASDYENAADLGLAICGGTVRSLSATSSKANEPSRWVQ